LIVESAVSELNFLQMKMSAISCFFFIERGNKWNVSVQ